MSFIIGLTSLIYALRKVNAEYQFGKGPQKNINYFFFIVDSKLYGNNKKGLKHLQELLDLFDEYCCGVWHKQVRTYHN